MKTAFSLKLENKLGSGYGNELMPLTLDGKEIPLKDSYFRFDSQDIPFSEVSPVPAHSQHGKA